jgi:hypothetical protein
LFEAARGPKSAKIFLEAVGTLSVSMFPERASGAVKAASFIRPADNPSGKNNKANRKPGTCERCGVAVSKGGWKEHNRSCRKEKKDDS